MKSMAKKKIGGFMCHSPAATAVCMTGPDSRAVVIPGRRSSSERNIVTNCITNTPSSNLPSGGGARYSKLVDYNNIKLNNSNNHDNRRHLHRHRDQSQAKLSGGGANNNNRMIIVKSQQNEEQAVNNNMTLISGVVSATSTNNSDRQIVLRDELDKSTTSGIDLLPRNNVFQVVVMRVSLHCQGCAGKLKKHIAKMEGVTSFSIELEHKRVTVMGHVSPVVVLENISKVRRAEFWPSSASSTDHYLRHF